MLIYLEIIALSVFVLVAGVSMFHMKSKRKASKGKMWAVVLLAFWGCTTFAALCFKASHPKTLPAAMPIQNVYHK